MKLHRFLLGENIKQPLGEEIKVTEKNLLHQWINVLKFKKDEKVIFFDGLTEKDFIYKIKDINNKSATLEFEKSVENISQNKEIGDINLCFSLVKKEKVALIVEKCTEIGVLSFISLVSDRTEKKNLESFNSEKVQKIAIEAVEQSGWGIIPKVYEPKKIENFIKDLENKGELEKSVVLHTSDSKNHENILKNKENLRKIGIKYVIIGPEGGWSDKEIGFFEEKNLNFINFGKNTLRAETAAIVSSFLISL